MYQKDYKKRDQEMWNRRYHSPGDGIMDCLKEHGMSVAELATRMGFPQERINQFITNEEPMTEEVADKLWDIFWVGQSYWMEQEQRYRWRLANPDQVIFNKRDQEIWDQLNQTPGDGILDCLKEHRMSIDGLAGKLGFTVERVHQLIANEEPMTEEVADKLCDIFMIGQSYWMEQAQRYRDRSK